MTIETIELLAAHPFLAGLTGPQLERLAPWTHRSLFHASSRVFSEGGKAERFWLIREGQVAIDTQVPGRTELVVETLGPGAVLGWSWLFPPYRWHLGATAVTRTLAFEFDGPGVRRVCTTEPEIGIELYRRFIQVVVDRLQSTRLRLIEQLDT